MAKITSFEERPIRYHSLFDREREREGWCVEWSEAVDQTRTRKAACRMPERPKRGLYYSWIQSNNINNLFWTDWIIWDLDSGSVEEIHKLVCIVARTFRERGVPNDCVRVVFTSNRGFHIYLDSRILGLKPSLRLHSELKAFCLSVIPSADTSLYDKRHIIGLPNSKHKSSGGRYIMQCADEFLAGTLPALREIAKTEQREIVPRVIAVKPIEAFVRKLTAQAVTAGAIMLGPTKDLPKADDRLSKALSGSSEGGRNRAMFEIAQIGRQKRLSYAETLVFVRGANLGNRPPLSEQELEKIVRSAFSG